MYTNIPIDDCKMKLLNFIASHSTEINLFGLCYTDLENMLHTVMNESYFRFGKRVYHQLLGLGMGHRYSPPAANIYVYILEVELIESWNTYNPNLLIDINKWFRALDDIFSIWDYDVKSLERFLEFANNFHPTIKFTLDHSYTTANYLDITISKDATSRSYLTTELFIKPTHSGVSLNYFSKHPRHVIVNTGRNHFRRAKLLSNCDEAKLRSFQKISDLLLANKYPTHIIEKLKMEVDAIPDEPKVKTPKVGPSFTLTLPFVNDNILAKCKEAVKLSKLENVQIASKPAPNLKKRLIQTPFEPTQCPKNCPGCELSDGHISCTSRMVVYQLVCLLCLESYLGETYRAFYQRLKEHLASVKKDSDDLTISTHFREFHPDIPLAERRFKCAILEKCNDYKTLMITEAELIAQLDPKINVYSGRWHLH